MLIVTCSGTEYPLDSRRLNHEEFTFLSFSETWQAEFFFFSINKWDAGERKKEQLYTVATIT